MLQLLAFIFCASTMIRLQDQQIHVTLAQTREEQIKGLQGWKKLGENEGMLFVYKKQQILSFWMKGVEIPLSIGFFNEKKALIGVEEMSLVEKGELFPKTYLSKKPALYALEMPEGWFEKHKIKIGARFDWE